MQIKASEHAFFCGLTGSGKTTLVKKIYKTMALGHVVIIDPKHELTLDGAEITKNPEDINRILNAGKEPGLFKTPRNVILRINSRESYDRTASICYARGNVTLILDEATEIIPEGGLSEEYRLLLVAGRSRKATVWSLTQRPALISKTAISQSNHHFIFTLLLSHDKKAVAANIPLQVEDIERLRPWWFYHYYQFGGQKPVLHEPIR